MLGGLPGLAAHQRRLAAVERFPGLAVRSLDGAGGRGLVGAARAAGEGGAGGRGRQPGLRAQAPRAMALRAQLYAQAASEVLASLKRNDSAGGLGPARAGAEGPAPGGRARWALRAWTATEAWSVRELGMRQKLYAEVARSLTRPEPASARTRCARRCCRTIGSRCCGASPALDSPFASGLREQLADKALKLVLRSLTGPHHRRGLRAARARSAH